MQYCLCMRLPQFNQHLTVPCANSNDAVLQSEPFGAR